MTMRVHYELLTNFLRAELCVDHDNSGVQGFPTNVGAPRFSVQHRDGISRALRVLTVLGWSGPSIYKCRMICFKKQPQGSSESFSSCSGYTRRCSSFARHCSLSAMQIWFLILIKTVLLFLHQDRLVSLLPVQRVSLSDLFIQPW